MTKFAILGHGVVGSGTAELFFMNKDLINKREGFDLELGYILDIRDFPGLSYSNLFTKDINDILGDPEVKVVAEVMGGVNPAFDFVKRCLEKGKSVCTSNKELVAKKGAELLKTAREHNCNFAFEASTGGAIPVIEPMHTCLCANELTGAAGIVNGTTNFILTKMIEENMPLERALKTAQDLGYAEKDPTADIEGHDACRKICILASMISGKHVYPEMVPTEGIMSLTLEDAEYASANGYALKLIASVEKHGDKYLPLVAPRFVSCKNQLAHVTDVFNAITVYGNGFDEVMFYGKGAGKLPTASAVLGDVITCAKANGTVMTRMWEDSTDDSFIEKPEHAVTRLFVRTTASKDEINAAMGEVTFLKTPERITGENAFITAADEEGLLNEKLSQLAGGVITTIRVLK